MTGKGPVEVVNNGVEAAKVAVRPEPSQSPVALSSYLDEKDTVFSMLPDSDAVNSVYLDRFTGVIAGAKAAVESQHVNKLIVECCTIESATNLEVAKAAEDAEKTLNKRSSIDFVDALVSGGSNGAANGTLAFMVGTSRPE